MSMFNQLDRTSIIDATQNRQLLDSHVIISETDLEGKIIFVNDKFCEISGYSEGELIGKTHSLLKSGRHSPEFYKDLWKTISIGETWSGEICNRKKSGEFYWVQASISLFKDDFGEPSKYVSYRTDISQIKKHDEAHLALLNTMKECIHGLDKDGYCEFINPAAYQGLGYSEQELIGHRLHDIIHSHREDGTEIKESECAVFKTLVDKESRKCEDWFIRKDGSGFPVELLIAPRFENGNFIGVLLSYHDITHRREAQEKLKESEERLSIAINGTQSGVWDWFIEIDKVFISDSFATMLGFSQKELTPYSVDRWSEMLHPEDRQLSHDKLQQYLSGETSIYENTFRFKCKDGSWKWLLSRGEIVSYDTAMNPIRMTGIHTDISKLKQLEFDLQQAKDYAEQANQAKSDFLSSMSHELRTPLNAILGFSQLLTIDPELPLAEVQSESVNHIMKGGKHLLSLIEEVLQLSAIEAGKVKLDIQNISLSDVVEETILLTQTMAELKKVQVISSIPELFVKADELKLKQVLLNLVSNAIKYNCEAGNVTIDFSITRDNQIKINVIDTGIGIDENKQHMVFSAFNRLGQESSETEGTGIGLVVTKGLIELMHGSIGFDSQINKGTTFWIVLPLAETTNTEDLITDRYFANNTNPLNIGSSTVRHILYVEDNSENSDLMKGYFDMLPGLQLHTVETAESGIEILSQRPFDLILMDINLSGMDGVTLTKYVKSLRDSGHTPVIAITANAMPEDIEKSEKIFDSYLTKPIDFQVLASEMRHYL
jgi:two-component system sensor histidine kinase/response regulator